MLPTARLPRLPVLLLPFVLAAALLGSAPGAGAQERVYVPALYPTYGPAAMGPVRVDTAGLRMRLSEGRAEGGFVRPAAAWTPLDDGAVQRLLGRLPPLGAPETPADSFAFPAQSLPAPRTGRTVLAAFPPPDSAPPRPAAPLAPAPLQVTRRAPEGEVRTGAERVVVAFSEPLASVGNALELANRINLPQGFLGEVRALASGGGARSLPDPPGSR